MGGTCGADLVDGIHSSALLSPAASSAKFLRREWMSLGVDPPLRMAFFGGYPQRDAQINLSSCLQTLTFAIPGIGLGLFLGFLLNIPVEQLIADMIVYPPDYNLVRVRERERDFFFQVAPGLHSCGDPFVMKNGPEAAVGQWARVEERRGSLAPAQLSGQPFVNFISQPVGAERIFGPETLKCDPLNGFTSHHNANKVCIV